LCVQRGCGRGARLGRALASGGKNSPIGRLRPIGGGFCRSWTSIDLRGADPGQLTNEGHRRRTIDERWRWATGGHSSVNCRAEDARCYASTGHGLTPAGVLDRRKRPLQQHRDQSQHLTLPMNCRWKPGTDARMPATDLNSRLLNIEGWVVGLKGPDHLRNSQCGRRSVAGATDVDSDPGCYYF